jgi:YHS domain-containing protein
MKTILSLLSFIILESFTNTTTAQNSQLNTKNKLAVEGYDVVAYFKQNKAVKGNKDFAVAADGTIYYFTTAENKEAFKANAKMYLPQYGGWCAYAMGATGEKVEIDPETFKIVNNKLYLFYHTWTNNTLTKWNKDEAKLKAAADASWLKFTTAKN